MTRLLEKNMKKTVLFCVLATLALSACNTVHGIGKDLERAGSGISGATK